MHDFINKSTFNACVELERGSLTGEINKGSENKKTLQLSEIGQMSLISIMTQEYKVRKKI